MRALEISTLAFFALCILDIRHEPSEKAARQLVVRVRAARAYYCRHLGTP